jgi:PST family polysaccharide transporter
MNSFRKNLFSGVLYTGISKYLGILLSIVIGAILARLLTPTEFGLVALVTVFIGFFRLLSNVGIGPAVVQNQKLTDTDIESIFLFSLILGFLFGCLFFLSSTFIASFYGNPELVPIVQLLSITIFFTALQIVPNAILLKQLKFKKIGIITISIQLISGALAILLAYRGFSYFALVYKSIFDSFFTFLILFFLAPIRIKLRLNTEALKKIMRFSTFQFLFNFINYFSRNSDNLLIGRFIGPAALGYYDKSYRLMMMPVQNLTHVISPVLLPVLSEYNEDKAKIYSAYIKLVKLLATIGFPLSVFLYFAAPELILILYGSQWTESIPVFKILALSIGIQIVLSSSGAIFQAVNRTDLLFYSGFLSAILMVSGICYGIFIGQSLESVGWGLIFAFTINFFQGFYFLIKKALGFHLIKFLRNFIYPVFMAILLSLVLYLFKYFDFHDKVISLALKSLTAISVFSIAFFIKKNNRYTFKKIMLKNFNFNIFK